MLTPEQIDQLKTDPLVGRNKVARAKELAKVTQVQIAEGTGLSQPFISSIENGKYGPEGLPLETTRCIADYFGVGIEDLFPAHDRAVAS